MSRNRFRHVTLTATVLVAFAIGPASAELSTDPIGSDAIGTLVMGITEDPDPFPPLGWHPYRDIPDSRALNPGGADREDGRPDIFWRVESGWPVVVWAYRAGTDFDVAYSEWDGTSWTEVDFLTSTTHDELDPRVSVEIDGTVHVVWWEPGPTDHVYLSTRSPGSTVWSAPVQVSSEETGGRRPSVVVVGGVLRVAYERECDEPEAAQEIAVARREAGGGFSIEVVAQTQRETRLDAILHLEEDLLWVDWKQGAGELGYAESGGSGWTSPRTEPWVDSSWVGVEDIRRVIRRRVLLE